MERHTPNRPAHRLTAALTLSVVLVAACAEPVPPPARVPPTVIVAQPTRGDVQVWAEFTGHMRAFEYAEVRARVAGTLEGIHFAPSTKVVPGQHLFSIEPEAFQAARDSALARLKSADAELARAASDLSRIELAIKTDAVSQQDLDLATAKRDQADASVLAAKAELDKAMLDLSYTTVVAPIAGTVGRNLVDAGNLVGTGEPTLLTTINLLDPIHVYFEVPEDMLLVWLEQRRRGELPDAPDGSGPPAFVGTAVEEGYPHRGPIDYVDNKVDSGTGTILLRAVLPNTEGILFPGLFVRVRVPGKKLPDVVLIKERAVGTDLAGKYVYVIGDNSIVEQRQVELGVVQDDGTVPILAGLDGDETYILDGLLRARPGLPVKPQLVAE